VVDSSTIALIAFCIDWAQHRRRKAAAKLHVRLDLHSLLPRFVLVESAKATDSIRAAEVRAGVKSGKIVIFDRAYVDFVHLGVLNEDGVFWVTRSKESLSFRVVKKLPKGTDKRILRDELVLLKNEDSRANNPKPMRRVRALAEVDGEEREMEFLAIISPGAPAVWLICIAAAGRSKCSLSRLSRACSCAISWATAQTRSGGRSGRRCCSMS
jgi:hypothetical protein